MPFDVEAARKDGYSDADISNYLSQKSNFDITSAKKDGYTDADIIQHLSNKSPKGPTVLPEGDTTSDFMRGIRNYLPGLQEMGGAAQVLTGIAADKMGAKETGKELIKSGTESMSSGQAKQVVRETDEFTKAWDKGIASVVTDWLPYQMGAGVANIAETLAAMGIGAGVGAIAGAGAGALPGAIATGLSKTLVKKGVLELAKDIAEKEGEAAAKKYVQAEAKKVIVSAGVTTGMVGQAVGHGMGEVTGRALEEAEKRGQKPEDLEMSRVLPAVVAHSVADFISNKIGIDALKIGEKASKYLIADITKRIGVTGLKEIPAEEFQTMAERYGADLSLSDAEALKDYVNTAAASFGMSVVPGTVGGARTNLANKAVIKDKELKDQELKTQEKSESPIVGTTTTEPLTQVEDPELMAMLEAATPYKGQPPTTGTNEQTIADAPNVEDTTAPVVKTELDQDIEKRQTELADLKKTLSDTHPKVKNKQKTLDKKIAERTAQQGASSGTTVDTTTDRTSTDVAKPADTNVSTKGVTTPADGGLGTDGNVSTAPSAGKGTPPAPLAPQIVEHIQELRDDVRKLANDGKGRKLNGTRSIDKPYTRAVNAYNAAKKQYDESGGNLSATYRNVKELIDVDEQAYTPGLREDLPATEKEQTTDFETNLAESYKGKESGYEQEDLPPTAQEDYEDELAANNVEVTKHNENHAALVKAQKDARKEYNDATKTLQEYEETAEDSDQFDTVVSRVEEQIAQLKQQVDIANEALQNYGRERTQLPTWGKLERDEKDVYFSHIKPNSSIEERQKAARVLQAYRADKVARGLHKEESGKVRVINGYSEDKDYYSKFFNLAFPQWESLSKVAQDIYIKTLSRTDTNAETGKTNTVYINAGIQKPLAFARVGVQILTEARSQVKEETQKAAATRAELQKTISDISIAQQERDKQLREDQQRGMPSPVKAIWLPSKIVKILSPTIEAPYGNLQGVLNYMRNLPKSNQHVDILRAIAQSLYDLKLNTKIKLVDKLSKKDLAQYSPETDTVYLTKEGFTVSTVLHELVHAATVRIISMYEYVDKNTKSPTYGQHTQRSKLTAEQIRGVENLKAIMEETRDFLSIGGKDPAFKNLLEFVAYSLTDASLQNGLRDFSPSYAMLSKLGMAKKEIVASKTSVWSELLKTIAEILGISSKPQVKNNVNKPNFLFETIAAFNDIMSVPTEPIFLGRLSATSTPKNEKEIGLRTVDLNYSEKDGYGVKDEDKPKGLHYFRQLFLTVPGWKRIATKFQNSRFPIKSWEDAHELAEKIYHSGKDKINNIYTQITLAAANAKNYYTIYVGEAAQKLNIAVNDFSKASGLDVEKSLILLHKVMEALHEPERRMVKYLMLVPLNNSPILTQNGKQISPADRRKQIFDILDTKKLSEAQAQQLRKELDSIVAQYKDAYGYSRLAIDGKPMKTELEADIYNVTGLTQDSVKTITEQYEAHPQRKEIDAVLTQVKALNTATKTLDKISNYWSQPVSNRSAFYGWKNYIPLKGAHDGMDKGSLEEDQLLNFGSARMGKEMQDFAYSFDGRISPAEDPILRVMSDATRAAMRAGRRNLTQSIKNSLAFHKDKNPYGQGLLEGYVIKTIAFKDRSNPAVLEDIPRENTVFHYNEDGTIDILNISDRRRREAIRRTYQESKPVVELANKITSAIGTLHTRYNYSFAPMNFVRDAMTNAFTIGADMGPTETVRFIRDISAQVLKGGMYKSMKVALLYQKGDKSSQAALKQLADNDPYIKNIVEFIETGGMVSYLQGLSMKSNFQELYKEIGKTGIIQKKEQLDKFVDIWTDMFELASRGAAYGIAKRNETSKLEARVKSGKMTQEEAEETAKVKATAYSKNLANFEQVGDYGKLMGAFFMFFRPSATGAVRAIESVAPAFRSLDNVVMALPATIREDADALATFKKNYAERQQNARIMSASLMGLGMMAYFMAMMMSDDDDLGRNAVATDNMQQWTRFARFHIPKDITRAMGIKEPVVIQIPWGFGLGAFAASGAQIASVVAGKSSVADATANIFLQISLDSFVPIPISKMPPTDMTLNFFLDSIAPSVARPLLEFALNKNGLGQNIYNDQNRRMGDAYTGGDKIPEIYKSVAKWAANNTLGGIDVSPNTLYFLSNSYLDGVGRLFEAGYGMSNLSQGRKDFNPKTDLPLMGSFFGARSNVDSREFSSIEKKVGDMERIIKQFESDPVVMSKYDATYPLNRAVVDLFNSQVNNELKDLRSRAKEIRALKIAPNERDALLKIIIFQENIVKHNMIQQFKAYGVKP